MPGNMPNDRMQPSEFYDLEVLPALFAQLDQHYPEFEFRRNRKGWVARACPPMLNVRPDRIICLEAAPYYISVVEGDGMSWLAYENGGSTPRGERFVQLVREIAHKAGIDTRAIDGRELSPADKREIEERREELQLKHEARQRELDKQRAQDDAKARMAARELIERAALRDDRTPLERYFKRRGRRAEDLPPALLYTPDAGFSWGMIGALVAMVQDHAGEPCGCQRVFIENTGEPIEVEIDKQRTRKATLGRPDGGACVLGDPNPGDPLVLCEGVETGYAIHEVTGWCVLACISAGGLERIDTRIIEKYHAVTGSVVLIAGDLDRSMRGQEATAYAADRIRHELRLLVAEALPRHSAFPTLVGDDEMPLEGKSVDWEDAINESARYAEQELREFANGATLELSKPDRFTPTEPDLDEPEPDELEQAAAEQQDPVDPRKFKPYAEVYPASQLKAAHKFLLAHFGPTEQQRQRRDGLRLAYFAGKLLRWDDGYWIEYSDKPTEILRGMVRRYYASHCKAKPTRETPPRFQYIDANLSNNEVESIVKAALDEVAISQPTNEFDVQFWLAPSIDTEGDVVVRGGSYDRVIKRPAEHKLPDPTGVIPTIDGIIDLQAWRERTELVVHSKSPLLFNLGRIEAAVPIEEARACLEGANGIDALESFACGLCPEWCEFLGQCFRHDGDEECADAVMRELHKVMGNWIAGDMGYHQANLVWFVGPSGSGKSVLLQVVQALMGLSNIVSSTMSQLESPFHLRSWIGKKLALFPDMEIGRQDKRTLVERLKLISTGDPVAIDRKYLDEIPAYRLGTRMAIATNNMPTIPDPTQAIARRSLAFDMRHSIPIERQDPHLAERLTSPRSLAGILLLCLIGIKHVDQDKGFTQPKWYAGLMDDLKAQSSEYAQLIEDYLVVPDLEGKATEDDLYALYVKLGEENGQSFKPKRASMMTQLKTCLTGYGWARSQPEVGEDGRRYYRGFSISQQGLAMVHEPSGSDAGGFDGGLDALASPAPSSGQKSR